MRRIDRAMAILGQISQRDLQTGVPRVISTVRGDLSYRQIQDQEQRWRALITPRNQLVCAPISPFENVLDLWVQDRGKVLSLEFGGDEANLISMRRGAWEGLFGLPIGGCA